MDLGARSLVEHGYQALDRHLDYWSKIGTKPHLDNFRAFARTYWGGNIDVDAGAKSFMLQEQYLWSKATTTLIERDIVELVAQGAEVMPTATLLPETLPYPHGIVMMPNNGTLFEYEVPADLEVGIEAVPVVAIGWETNDRIMKKTPDGSIDYCPGVTIWLYLPTTFLKSDGSLFAKNIVNLGIAPTDVIPWAFNSGWTIREENRRGNPEITWDEQGNMEADPHVVAARKFMLSLWSFMRDEIVQAPRQHLPRNLSRRASRTPIVADLRILKLRKVRRPGSECGGETERQYSHRWLVRGHWRKLSSGRLTWVTAHIKGPPDAPFVFKNDIVAVTR